MENLSSHVEDIGEGKGGGGEETTEEKDGPPVDDCCPICFGDFTVPCKADCGHWYCGSCILQFWNYSSPSKPCKCPMCARFINRLTPEASLCNQQEHDVTEILKNVTRYNLLFIGGARGLIQKTRSLGIVRVFDYAAVLLVIVLRLIGLYRRRRLTQRVRHLAATQPLAE